MDMPGIKGHPHIYHTTASTHIFIRLSNAYSQFIIFQSIILKKIRKISKIIFKKINVWNLTSIFYNTRTKRGSKTFFSLTWNFLIHFLWLQRDDSKERERKHNQKSMKDDGKKCAKSANVHVRKFE